MNVRYYELRDRFRVWLSSDYDQTSLPQAAIDTLREFLGLTDGMAGDFSARCRDLEEDYNRRVRELKAVFDLELEQLRESNRTILEEGRFMVAEECERCAKIAEDPYSEAVACEGTMEPTEVGMRIADAMRRTLSR